MKLLGASSIGTGTLIADDVVIGHPSKESLNEHRDYSKSAGAWIGTGCILRSGTVIYENVRLGNRVQTAHHVVIRESVQIGDGCIFGNGTVVRENARLGNNVRLMESVVISEGAIVGDDVFVGPNVSFTAGRHMTGALQASGRMSDQQAREIEGRYWTGPSVVVGAGVRIGANAVILAGVNLGDGCVVAAGTVVGTDVPPNSMIAGNPGRVMRGAPK